MFFRRLNHLDHLLNAVVLSVCLALGAVSIALIATSSFSIYPLLCAVSSFLIAIWLVIRLVPFSLRAKLAIDSVVKVFQVVTSALYLFHQHPSQFNTPVSVLCIVAIIFVAMTLMTGLVLCNVSELPVVSSDSDIESGPSHTHSSTSTKSSDTRMSLDEYVKKQSKSSSMDNNNWMNVQPLEQPKEAEPDQMTLHDTRSMPNFDQIDLQSQINLNIDSKQAHTIPQNATIPNSEGSKSHETLIPNCNSDNSIHQHLEYDYVKRSKSTSHLMGHSTKRQERWKSINDERVFLQKINENLLPAVLKTSESPILALKRQQLQSQSTLPESVSSDSVKTVDHITEEEISGETFNDPEYTREYNYNTKAKTMAPAPENNSDIASADLPYVSEFDAPPEEIEFEDFDQNTRVEYEQDIEEFKIPRTMTKQWIPKSQTQLNHISLDKWNDNAVHYQNFRSRSGVNLNIPGISRIVSDKNLVSRASTSDDFLLPPVDNRADNLDNLSDLASSANNVDSDTENVPEITARPLFSHSNRSLSAPSLQTFRNVSKSSSAGDSLQDLQPISLTRLATPPPFDLDIQPTKSSSPIRKLYQSPRKLFRRSTDHGVSHKHSNSVISSQFSLYSSTSKASASPRKSQSHGLTRTGSVLTRTGSTHSRSRSTSPKRSFKALISRKPSMNQGQQTPTKLTVPPPTLLKQAQVKRQEAENTELDFWDLQTRHSIDNSRVSSIPSAVIGEYDREKWTTLKALNDGA